MVLQVLPRPQASGLQRPFRRAGRLWIRHARYCRIGGPRLADSPWRRGGLTVCRSPPCCWAPQRWVSLPRPREPALARRGWTWSSGIWMPRPRPVHEDVTEVALLYKHIRDRRGATSTLSMCAQLHCGRLLITTPPTAAPGRHCPYLCLGGLFLSSRGCLILAWGAMRAGYASSLPPQPETLH